MSDFLNTQQALSDIQLLKQAILRSKSKLALTADSVDTHLVLNVAAGGVAAMVAWGQLGWPEITHDLLFSTAADARYWGVAFVGAGLMCLLAVAYGYISFRARKEQTSFTDFSDRYFAYFKNLSALSDIFVKFCAFALLVLAGKPEWVAALFVFFIGDLVMQGRLLILSSKVAMMCGVICFAAAGAMLGLGVSSLLAPAGIALVLTAFSLANILNFRSKILSAQE